MTTEREELAWAAGLFDGEGTVGAYVRRKPGKGDFIRTSRHIGLKVVQVDRRVLDRFAVACGLTTTYVRPSQGRHKPLWSVEAAGIEKVQAVGALLWEWLSPVKRLQFAAALQTYNDASAGMRFVYSNGRRRHGTFSKYNGGCRCDPCKEAATAYHRQYREKNREKLNAYKREWDKAKRKSRRQLDRAGGVGC